MTPRKKINGHSENGGKQTFTISAFSENHIGLLNRITIIFTRRRVNIDSLTVSGSAIPGIHKFTIVVHDTPEKVEQVVSQIEKLVEVLKAFSHSEEEVIHQEIALYNGFTGKAGTLCEFIRREETPVFLPVEFCFSGLDVDNTLAAFALSATDHIHRETGPLGSIKYRCTAFHNDFPVAGEESYRSHTNNSLLLTIVTIHGYSLW